MSEQITNIRFPVKENILISLKKSKAEFINDILYFSALSFYQRKKLSIGKAAELAGLDKIDFIHKIQEEEAIFNYTEDEIAEIFSDVDKICLK